jgi:hypothetical protein
MSVQMKVRLVALKTNNGLFDFSDSGSQIGTEFWVDIATVAVRTLRHKSTGEFFQAIMVRPSEAEYLVPIEILEFINEFKAVGL